MKFVFDLDGTLSFDGVTIDEEIKQVLVRAEEFGHEVAFASARSYRDCTGKPLVFVATTICRFLWMIPLIIVDRF